MPKRIALITGVVLAVLSIVLVKIYLDQERQKYTVEVERIKSQTKESRVPVLVANQDIPQGKPLDPSMVAVVNAPSTQVPPQAVTSMNSIAGMVTVTPLSRGEPLTFDRLAPIQQAASTSLALSTPVGKRAITIPVDNLSGLSGLIKPGDYVDVLCITKAPADSEGKKKDQEIVFPLFQNVLVLARGQELVGEAGQEKRETSAPTITLALSSEEASLIAFVLEQGKVRLLLRSPQDTSIEPVPVANWEALFQYIMPQEYGEKKAPEKEEAPREQVEIYRGLEKEVVPLSK